jgi:hypothetical protein
MYQPKNLDWDLSKLLSYANNIEICHSLDDIVAKLKVEALSGGHFVLMSNGSFGGHIPTLARRIVKLPLSRGGGPLSTRTISNRMRPQGDASTKSSGVRYESVSLVVLF